MYQQRHENGLRLQESIPKQQWPHSQRVINYYHNPPIRLIIQNLTVLQHHAQQRQKQDQEYYTFLVELSKHITKPDRNQRINRVFIPAVRLPWRDIEKKKRKNKQGGKEGQALALE